MKSKSMFALKEEGYGKLHSFNGVPKMSGISVEL
jgi:hypothetical protein